MAATGLGLGIVGMAPVLGWLVNILGIFIPLYMWAIGLTNAIKEKEKTVPFLGKKFEEWFKNI